MSQKGNKTTTKNKHAQALGRISAGKLTAEQRRKRAIKAVRVRWAKNK